MRHLNGLLIAAILLISTALLYAQPQQQNAAKLKADARNVVGTIGADKDKTQAYCQIVDLGRQLEQADKEKDRKKTSVLSQKINQLQKQIGPEFVMPSERRDAATKPEGLAMRSAWRLQLPLALGLVSGLRRGIKSPTRTQPGRFV
jgi:hypothetical protein